MRRTPVLALAVTLVIVACGPARGPHGGGCPRGMVHVAPERAAHPGGAKSPAPFCIDAYEASLIESTPKGDAPFSPYEAVNGRHVRAVSEEGAIPQGYISEIEAQSACKASGKRLCTEDEWVAACRGRKHTRFPYGDDRKAGYCNDDGKSPLIRLHAAEGLKAFSDDPMNDPRLNQQADTVARGGAHRLCTNDYGVFDMVGNLHEWVDDPAGTFRGGYYLDTRLNGDGCTYRTTAHDAAYKDYSTGFRCCADGSSRL